NSTTGSDELGTGDVEQPYKTITQAVRMAPTTSAVLLLAPGHYSRESGESFPLRLRPGMTIQGNSGETRNTIIAGGGEFRGDDQTQNVTIVTSDRSGLANVAVSNPKGSGVWITGGTPVLRRVALVSNAVAGVQVANGAPVIENSYFNRNQQGISIRGVGRAIVRGNYFEATGRAITVASPATPAINNNRIARNDVGIALKNNARPVLEANVLDGNGRNGVVEVDAVETAVAPSPVPSAPPATATPSRRSELIEETVAITRPAADAPGLSAVAVERRAVLEPAPVPDEEPEADAAQADVTSMDTGDVVSGADVPDREIASFRQHLATSSISAPSAPAPVTAEERPAILQRRQSLPAEAGIPLSEELATEELEELATEEPVSEPLAAEALAAEDAVAIAVIPAAEPTVVPDTPTDEDKGGISKLLARLNQSSAAPIASPQPLDNRPAVDNAVVASGQRLPVPSATIPSSGGSANLSPPGTLSLARSFRYRVLVNMADSDELQTLVPDAFRTRVGSDMFMQAGAYVDEVDAQERLGWLRENGIDGRVDLRE
ncbi:MAG: DUF1565 domain-containing protein, partial [Cyanobacteria bacterium J06649_12]